MMQLLWKKYLKLTNLLFSQVNPIPVKAALAKMGLCENVLRLPLVPMEKPYEDKLVAAMEELGLL